MITNNAPLLSVVIASFNEPPAVLLESLRSVQAQSLTDFECIVVDDSTKFESADACRAFCEEDSRFVYIHPPERLGLSKSLNVGLRTARGRFIARFDADDVNMSDRFKEQLLFLEQHPDVDVVGSNIEITDETGKTIAFREYPEHHTAIARGMHLTATLANPTTIFRREAYERMGGYNPEFTFAEDLELWLRWINGGVKFANIQKYLIRYRKQDARRNSTHWRLNLKARMMNYRWDNLPSRLLGIAIVAIWIALPSRLQVAIFNLALLRKVKKVIA
jgi:glycosyltransferase involved in cell wall biosynthesis